MISSLTNLSMPWTCFSNVSNKTYFMDTFLGCVHALDMNGRVHATTMLDVVITDNFKGLVYGD
jgi:hypothetical protein